MKHLNSFLKFCSCGLMAMLLALAAGMSVPVDVRANDTEVFFPPQQVDPNFRPANPNIMFVIDTSGSMGQADGETQTRLQRVQSAFKQIIQDMNQNVNVGLMRFSGLLGGSITFPVAPIDAYVDEIDTTATGDRYTSAKINDFVSEAIQATSGTPNVTVAPATLQISATNTQMGLRFDNVQIPQGVVITDAQVLLYRSDTTTGSNTANIDIELADNAAPYSAVSNNVSGRTYSTGSKVLAWTIPNVVTQYDDVTTVAAANGTNRLKDLVNDVIGRAGWCGGNALALRVSRTAGSASFVSTTTAVDASVDPESVGVSNLSAVLSLSFSPTDTHLTTGCNKAKLSNQIANQNNDSTEAAGGANAPACTVLYLNTTSTSAVSGCGGNTKTTTAGLRFPNLNIPRGATIVSAFIDFTPYATDTQTPTLTIKAENASNAAAYAATNNNLSTRLTTPGVVASTATWNTVAWSSTSVIQTTPDLKALVQNVVDRTDWDPSSNALSFIITGAGGSGKQKAANSFDGSASKSPRLRIQISGPTGRQTVRQYLQEAVDSFVAFGGTPTMSTLYEAARYFRGESALYGRTRSYGNTFSSGVSVRYPGSGGSSIQVDASSADYAAASRISHRASFSSNPTRSLPAQCNDNNLGARVCDGESWAGTTTYKSPITDGCQSNNIVFLSDGLPNVTTSSSPTTPTNSAASNITLLPGFTPATCAIPVYSGNNTAQPEWQCANELASYLFNKDQSSTLGGVQNVRTYTIAFGPSVSSTTGSEVGGAEFLQKMALNGGGKSFAASSVDQVTAAFKAIVGNILDINTTFVAPAVTVNTFNRLTNRNEVYYALFKPSTGVNWVGNLKRYQLLQKYLTESSPNIYDNTSASSNGPLRAVDPSTGLFADTDPGIAQTNPTLTVASTGLKPISFWSAAADGGDIGAGGAASVLPAPAARKVYTYINSTAPSDIDLSGSNNYLLSENNALITSALLNLPATATATDRTKLLQWARGVDVLDYNNNSDKTEARAQLGDPLHSEPQLVTYGGTDASPDIAIAMGTNDGGLHLFNAADGVEYFSFVPQEHLSNFNTFYNDTGTYLNRPNGMDGPISAWTNDANGNGKIMTSGVVESGEFIYIYAGMRRGSNDPTNNDTHGSYYALDITNRTAPKLKFQIKGGTGSYIELGQTWSRAIKKKIRIGKANKDVIIFSGGYDPAVDGQLGGPVAANSQGRALYVADASTGALLWWAGYDDTSRSVHPNLSVPAMTYSVPATPLAMDLDNDGLVDRIYIADTGGQIFRFILGKDSTDTGTGKDVPSLSNTSVQRIAALSGTTTSSAHRFYSTPDVALINSAGSPRYLAIAIGSGFREHPLTDENEDRIYVLKDPDITNGAASTLFINGDTDLYDATANDLGSMNSTTKTTAATALATKKGFYIRLVEGTSTLKGEKVIAPATIFNNQVLVATFQPTADTTSSCLAAKSTSRLYQFNVTDGTPVMDYDNPTAGYTLTREDRAKKLVQRGLPPEPTILFPSISVTTASDGTQSICTGASCLPDKALMCVGMECFGADLSLKVFKSFWQKVEN